MKCLNTNLTASILLKHKRISQDSFSKDKLVEKQSGFPGVTPQGPKHNHLLRT